MRKAYVQLYAITCSMQKTTISSWFYDNEYRNSDSIPIPISFI